MDLWVVKYASRRSRIGDFSGDSSPMRPGPGRFGLSVMVEIAWLWLRHRPTSWISGELVVGWGHLVIDIGQVALAGMLTWILAARWQRRSWLTQQ